MNYVDKRTALREGYAKITDDDQLYIGADHKKVVGHDDIGRDSVRLESKRTWSKGLLIADFEHMPGNQCGIWPALLASPFPPRDAHNRLTAVQLDIQHAGESCW